MNYDITERERERETTGEAEGGVNGKGVEGGGVEDYEAELPPPRRRRCGSGGIRHGFEGEGRQLGIQLPRKSATATRARLQVII